MENFEFECKTKILFGKGSVEKIREEIARYGKRILFIPDAAARKYGLASTILNLLKEQGTIVFELDGVQPNPRLSTAQNGIEIAKREKIDLLLVAGGGSAIDTAKTIAVGACYDGNVWDFYEGKTIPQKVLPLGVILTIPATGSEMSDGAVITNEDGMLKRPLHSQLIRPAFSILDPELTYTLPPYQTAAGAVDIMSHVMERYFTPTIDVELTDRLSEAVMITVKNNLLKVMKNPSDYEARANIMWCGSIAHNDLLSTGRVQDWASHYIGHELSAMFDTTHGATLSIITPAWMKYIYKKHINRFVQFAVRVWGISENFDHPEETALQGIDAMIEFFKKVGLPTSFSEAGLDTEKMEELADKATSDGPIGGIELLEKKDVLKILEMAK